jgi:replicative DNA helicase
MASNSELDLLARVIDEDGFKGLLKDGIDVSYFSTIDGINIFNFLNGHYFDEAHYGETASMDLVRRWHPDVKLRIPRDSVGALLKDLRRRRTKRELNALVDEVGDLTDNDEIDAALRFVADQVSTWNQRSAGGRDMDISTAHGRLKERYDLIKSKSGLLGIPTPWAPLTRGTMGWQGGDLVILYGRPGNMKTWMACVIAAYAYTHGQRVLIFSAEMMEIAIMQRIACILTCVPYDDFRHAELHPLVEQEVFETLENLADMETEDGDEEDMPCLKVTTGSGIANGKSLEGIRQKVDEYQPDILIVDGIYLLHGKSQKMWESMTGISRGLKDMATTLNIPVIGITQANRDAKKGKGDDVSELAYADALGQDADIAMRAIRHFDEELGEHVVTWSFAKVREGLIRPFSVYARAANDFSLYKRDLNPTDVKHAVESESTEATEEDKSEGGKEEPKTTKRRRSSFVRRKSRRK